MPGWTAAPLLGATMLAAAVQNRLSRRGAQRVSGPAAGRRGSGA